jgi:hypothetical protein
MNFLEPIETQMICNRLPLAGISIAAVPCSDTPVVLSLHWHGFVEHKLAASSEPVFQYEAVPSSCLQFNERWKSLRELENALLDVSWELGAWDLARHELRPCMRPGAPVQEAIECEMAFGRPHAGFDASVAPVSEVPDVDDLLAVAGRQGYLVWRFRPVRGGMWGEFADDCTLERGGYRNPPCPLLSGEFADTSWMQRHRRHVYRFGRSRELQVIEARH